jgi:hypothetical protein
MATKKAAKKKRATGRRRGRRPGVAGMSIAQLEAAIARRRATEAKKLKAKRAKLAKALAGLDKQIAALSGATPKRGRPKKRVVRKKRGRPKKKVAKKRRVARKKRGRRKKVVKKKAKRTRSTTAQVARVQNAIVSALKGKKNGLLKVELTRAVRARRQTLNTALKKLLDTKKVKTKGVTRNTRYLVA